MRDKAKLLSTLRRLSHVMRTPRLNSYGGLTAALKRAVELQPAAEGRSFQVVIDGESTWQSQRLMEARFGSA